MSVTAIFLTNLPNGITREDLKYQLQYLHPNIFVSPYPETSIDVQVYTDGAPGLSVAVVKGIDFNFEKLILQTRGLKISHEGNNKRTVIIKPASIIKGVNKVRSHAFFGAWLLQIQLELLNQ
ncbi:hypothetical protein Fcan01_20724 [Folsomia candida]|uniref:Uncharacterized protein n=1 Tax=Folsomia candida TaxID=158441 RepID=A0A226DIT2_FOLCA|nr:hypothetical protein Fcan01_20724 [Folsomia candida]